MGLYWIPYFSQAGENAMRSKGRMSGKGNHFWCTRGYVLVAFSLSLLVTLGAVGLSVDVGRMYITRGEARSFCDAAAIAAALQLDGTTAGLTRANNAALATVKNWEFGTKQFDPSNATIAVEFGRITGGHCDFSVAPNPAASTAPGYVCARVGVSNVRLPMFLMPVLTSVFSSNIGARATAAQVRLPGPGAGAYSPFSPFAHPILDPPVPASQQPVPENPGDPFNLKPGERYTLVWPNEQQLSNGSKKDLCSGDADVGRWAVKVSSSATSNRGYIYNVASMIADTIVANQIPPGAPIVNTGDIIKTLYQAAQGNMTSAATDLMNRVLQDSDSTSTSFANYHGNGIRKILVPINVGYCGPIQYVANGQGQNKDSYPPTYPTVQYGTNTCQIWKDAAKSGVNTYQEYQVIGWGEFFLLEASYYQKLNGNDSVCAEYIRPGSVLGGKGDTGSPNVFKVMLVE
jgi:hypothetical protein